MKMSKNFKQYNTEWAKLGYPKKPWYIKDCGCGEVAIANVIVETDAHKNDTPKTIQPWCKQFAAPNGDGTYWSAPPRMMAHYGLTECQEHQTMNPLWKELAKGNRVAIYLMSNRLAGSKGIKWTGSKHFICSTDYRYDKKTGKHWVYVKDSNSASESRNGWISYEDNLRNAVFKVWSGKLPKKAQPAPKKSVDEIAKEVLDGKWGNGDERVKKLKEAGYDPDAVQKRVNELLASNKIGTCANEYAYTTNTSKASYKSGAPTTAYKLGLDKAYPDRSKWGTPSKKGASCDVFVGTCVRNAGVDKSFPRGLADQIPYLAKSAKFKEVSVTTSTAKNGDIIVYTKTSGGGHICIVYGGKIKEAAHESYYPKTTDYLKQRLSTSGKKMLKVYRAVEETPAPKKTVDELAKEVLDGKWGTGDERKKRLTEAGYDYNAVQKKVNELLAPTLTDKILDACKAQAEWSKNSKYKWQKDPTIAKSKNYETCVTYTACVGQRVNIIPSGKYIWHNSKGKVVGATENFEIIYPKNKKLHDLKGVLKKGDFVMDGDKTDLESGSHIFVVTGEWKDGCPIVWDNHSAQQGKMAYKYTRNRPVIAIARPKGK